MNYKEEKKKKINCHDTLLLSLYRYLNILYAEQRKKKGGLTIMPFYVSI
jgi:hypothetical protein